MQTNDTAQHRRPAPAATEGRYDRFPGEAMAGGSVTERDRGRRAVRRRVDGAVAGLGSSCCSSGSALTTVVLLFVSGSWCRFSSTRWATSSPPGLTGMKATQFFIGFGPRLWSFQRGETEYGVRLLPLGAFVRSSA